MRRFLSFLLLGLCPSVEYVVVVGLSLSWYHNVDEVVALPVMRVLLFVLHMYLWRECVGVRLTTMLVWAMDEVW